MQQQSGKNPKAGYTSFFTNYKKEESKRTSGQRNYPGTSRQDYSSTEESLSALFQNERSKINEGSLRYSSAPLNSKDATQLQPRSFSQPASEFPYKSEDFKTKNKSNLESKCPYSGITYASRLAGNESSDSGFSCGLSGIASGRTEVEWEKQRVMETNMEWRQGHEKWRTRAEQVMQGYARELEKSLKEYPDALLKCP